MKFSLATVCALAAGVFAMNAYSNPRTQDPTVFDNLPEYVSAPSQPTHAEGRAQMVSAVIKSANHLERYLSAFGEDNTPFAALSTASRNELYKSLTFSDLGLSGFNYKLLEAELTPTQIHSLLSLFGLQHLTKVHKFARIVSTDDAALMGINQSKSGWYDDVDSVNNGGHKGYACNQYQRATCYESPKNICTDRC